MWLPCMRPNAWKPVMLNNYGFFRGAVFGVGAPGREEEVTD